jgi:DNA-directed RNA polymerase specialized sigma24 family protein
VRRDDFVDFFLVAPQHEAVDERLRAWAAWVRVRPHGWQVAPMFRQYRSKAWQWERPEPKAAVNIPEAVEMEKAVSLLPEKHREAIRFAYVWCGSPVKVSRDLGVSKQGLMDLINQGRTMLVNRTRT